MITGQEAYSDRRDGSVHTRVRTAEADTIFSALMHHEGCTPVAVGGRGFLFAFPLSDDRTGILRPCRRGGVLRVLLGDRYWWKNRPLAEFETHQAVLRRGIPAPELLGVVWERNGFFYRGALATLRMDGADLLEWLTIHAGAEELAMCHAQMNAAGRLVARMHDAGLWHADLQVKNLFVASDNTLRILDFDRARLGKSVATLDRVRNLLRFRRSLQKRGCPDSFFDAFLIGYGPIIIPFWLDMLYRIRGKISALLGWTKV